MDDVLEIVDPVHDLTQGLTDDLIDEAVNPHFYGPQKWRQAQEERFSVFDRRQCEVIIAYLRFRQERDEGLSNADYIEQALRNYWLGRLA